MVFKIKVITLRVEMRFEIDLRKHFSKAKKKTESKYKRFQPSQTIMDLISLNVQRKMLSS